jgi:hypothetical protein
MKFRVNKEFATPDGAVQIVGSVIECDRDRAAIYRRHGLIGTYNLEGLETATTTSAQAARIDINTTATETPNETSDDGQAPRKRGRQKKE